MVHSPQCGEYVLESGHGFQKQLQQVVFFWGSDKKWRNRNPEPQTTDQDTNVAIALTSDASFPLQLAARNKLAKHLGLSPRISSGKVYPRIKQDLNFHCGPLQIASFPKSDVPRHFSLQNSDLCRPLEKANPILKRYGWQPKCWCVMLLKWQQTFT